jgi:ATP phosphoribosyltransferase regulatory subunit
MDEGRPLEHPLPLGMRDLLPEEAEERRSLADAITARLRLHGYRLVTPPAFELASVVERGLKSDDEDDDLLRFIEPDSGEVAVFRPDITPQVARIVATRLGERTPPFRLAYEGSVLRRGARASRAKKHRQIPQVGVELFGLSGAEAELELLAIAAEVLEDVAGLSRFTIDLSDAGIVRELLADVPPAPARELSRALARKDEPTLAELCRDLSAVKEGARIRALAHLHGGREAVVEALALLRGSRAEAPAARLLALFDAAAARGLAARLSADPGEVRSLAYYTGTIFSIYAPGPGEPIGGGGRYDDLLARYGAPRPAVGFGLDLDALAWAIRAGGAAPRPQARGLVLIGPPDDARGQALRARDVPVVMAPDEAIARAYAASWGFATVLGAQASAEEALEALRVLEGAKERERGE